MNKFLTFIKKPPLWLKIITGVLFFISFIITMVFLATNQMKWFTYIVYVIAAISMSYFIYILVIDFNNIKQFIKNLRTNNKYIKTLSENPNLRLSISSIISTSINIIYCFSLLIMAIINHSIWIISLAIYYFILTTIKTIVLLRSYSLIKKQEKDINKEINLYKIVGISLILMAVAMTAMIVQMILMEADIYYGEIFIFVVATFTFYKLITAIIHTIKNYKSNNFLVKTIRNINLTSATVSLFSLQVALINTFSTGENLFILNLLTGICVSIFIIILGIQMQIYAKKYKKKEMNNEQQ